MMYRLNHLTLIMSQSKLMFPLKYGNRCTLFTNSKTPSIREAICAKCSCNSFVKVTTNSSLRDRHRSLGHSVLLKRHIQVSSENSKTCWSCNEALECKMLFCHACNSLQPVDKQKNLFHIMGIEKSFSLNKSELKHNFRNLQSLLHPDKFSSKPKKEQEFSEEFSSVVNKAYSTLLDPLERGLYLLKLRDISIEEGAMDMDKMFLMEIMERNEEIENESDPQKLNKFNEANREQLDLLLGKVAQAFDNNDMELAKKLLTEMKYYNTIEKKIKDIKQKLNIPD